MVFSIDRPGSSAQDVDRAVVTGILEQSGLKPRAALGVFKGNVENSWIVQVETANQEKLVLALAEEYYQECLLSICAKSFDTSLINVWSRRKELLGHWVKTDKLNRKGLTIDLTTMQGYVVV